VIALISQFSLALATVLALFGAVAGFAAVRGVYSHAPAVPLLISIQRNVLLVSGLVGIAFVGLVYSFVISDFSVRNVAENSNLALPVFYKVAASWGSHVCRLDPSCGLGQIRGVGLFQSARTGHLAIGAGGFSALFVNCQQSL
jgi:hypothetical protein